MNIISENDILTLQKMYGVDKIQNLINVEEIWKRNSINVLIKQCIENGICYIPKDVNINDNLKINYNFEKSIKFWSQIYYGDINAINKLEILFGVNVL